MKKYVPCVLLGFALALIFFLICGAFADEHHGTGEGHERGSHKHHGESGGTLPPVTSQSYKDTCGACHFCYPPGLLPSGSWTKLLAKLEDHFGQSVDVDATTKKAIGTYLANNAAERSQTKTASKIMASLGGRTPLRITEIPYIVDKHRRLSPEVFRRKEIGTLSNCPACHKTAEQGSFDKHSATVPK